MTVRTDDSRIDLIIKLDDLIKARISEPESNLIIEFLNQYYLGVSAHDLRKKTLEELYGALISHWRFIQQRMPGESKVKVYNPQLEQNGWQSPHTIIEIDHENKPFLLDSIRLTLNRLDVNVILLIHAEGIRFERDSGGNIVQVVPLDSYDEYKSDANTPVSEAPIFIEVDRQIDSVKMHAIAEAINNTLNDVDLMVRDWSKITARLSDAITTLEASNNVKSTDKLQEVIEFLRWLAADHFTFIGYSEYSFARDANVITRMDYIPNSGLGVLTESKHKSHSVNLDDLYSASKKAILSDSILLVGKTDTLSRVHRPAYTDFVAIKIFDDNGNLVKALRFIGLYTASAYNTSAENIPFVRKKIDRVFSMAAFTKDSHDGKTLQHIIETLPRDELFQSRDIDLFDLSIGILHLQERQNIRLFMRRDIYGGFFSCMVFVPKELFSSQLRGKMQDILMSALDGTSVTFDTKFSESILARIHFIIRVNPLKHIAYDVDALEERIIDASRTWNDDLHLSLNERYGEAIANVIFKSYANAFPLSYKEIFTAQAAVVDIEHIEKLKKSDEDYLEMTLYRPIEDPADTFRFKLFRLNKTIPLSDVVPILENMGLRIISERPHEIKIINNGSVWINDYRMVNPSGAMLETDLVKDIFQQAFDAVWHNFADNDAFNSLVLNADIPWRDINILRSYYKYLWQTGFVFSQNYVEDALYNNLKLAVKLVEYFYVKFDPLNPESDRSTKLFAIKKSIYDDLESVDSLNEDRIIRAYVGVLEATTRTNFFQLDKNIKPKSYISFKFDSNKVPDLPLPKPLCEIFVYNTGVQGIHLRADLVARGGIRWSDRHEDFRTEVLGLMKAQQVKNSIIIPLGAKGGFVVKKDLQDVDSIDKKNEIVIDCYKTLICGMLDLTDNYVDMAIVKPINTICWDADDPYLVVAADKGTATFSDIANLISKEYSFWLDDAFASGGCTGYDHKKMAITARGAWESVKLHFQKLGKDVQKQPFTVIGIGDMAGDVFGNGMLMSDKIKLIAAFNHMHIFFDPNPDPAKSFIERKRLFELPNSTWGNYDPKVISDGGGVFSRLSKSIKISPEMKKALNCTDDFMEPNVLMRNILKMQADLFFNGGIGTFVKASFEINVNVGDRVNDAIRINGNQLNVRVVCEGGNLGFTQLGRVEYAKCGGIINTDAIDNSAGVNCSDNEVNIKILLNTAVDAGDLTWKQRNQLLVSMTDNVASLVLDNNKKQNEALTLIDYQSSDNFQMHVRLQKDLEKNAGLDPAVEYLPDGEEVELRLVNKQGYTRPEFAILMAYKKIQLKKILLASTVPNDTYVSRYLLEYFPTALLDQKFAPYLNNHRLRRDIIATQISNYIVNEMGINFMQRLQEETGAELADIVRSYMITREVFDVDLTLKEIHSLQCSVAMDVQTVMWQDLNRLIRRATRWFVRNLQGGIKIESAIKRYKPTIVKVQQNLDQMLCGSWLDKTNQNRQELLNVGVPDKLADKVSKFYAMFTALDIADAALVNQYDVIEVGKVYFKIGADLNLGWFGELIKKQPVRNYWEALARASFRDDVDNQQRNLTISILNGSKGDAANSDQLVDKWLAQHKELLQRWRFFSTELQTADPGFTMFAIALRELLDVSKIINDNIKLPEE